MKKLALIAALLVVMHAWAIYNSQPNQNPATNALTIWVESLTAK